MLQSDSIVTVSPGYAAEIQTKLRTLQNASLRDLEVIGITSGIDTDVWNPSKDSFIPPSMHFTFLNIFSHKKRGKTYLQVLQILCYLWKRVIETIGIESG